MSNSGLWLAIFVVVGLLVGAAGGVLVWLGGSKPPLAIFTGGGCFAGAVLFQIAVAEFVIRS